jgi:hypothetical protein
MDRPSNLNKLPDDVLSDDPIQLLHVRQESIECINWVFEQREAIDQDTNRLKKTVGLCKLASSSTKGIDSGYSRGVTIGEIRVTILPT